MRQKIVAGNWKMHKNAEETEDLLNELIDKLPNDVEAQVIVAPTFINLASAVDHLEFTNIAVAAQNMSQFESGAYTGEISADMLKSIGVNIVIIGHSERRAYFNETNEELVLKIKEALTHHLKPIFCIGESLDQSEGGFYFDVIKSQLVEVLSNFTSSDCFNIIIAYEPIWAIGSGLTATSLQAQEMHAFIRTEISNLFSLEIAQQTSILYGGSCNAQNAHELFQCPDVDGGLIGGASLKAEDFCAIVDSF